MAKCFDAVSMIVEEASWRFAPKYRMVTECYDVLKSYCEALDKLAKEFDAIAFEGEIDEIKMTISIKMECPDMTIDEKEHIYYNLIGRTESFGFSVSEGGNLLVEFVFPSIWEKV